MQQSSFPGNFLCRFFFDAPRHEHELLSLMAERVDFCTQVAQFEKEETEGGGIQNYSEMLMGEREENLAW